MLEMNFCILNSVEVLEIRLIVFKIEDIEIIFLVVEYLEDSFDVEFENYVVVFYCLLVIEEEIVNLGLDEGGGIL